jgi:hypothetical protein
MKTEIEQRQTNRFRVLYETYIDSRADVTIKVKIAELAANKDIKNGVFKEAFNYLTAEGLLDSYGAQTGNITHKGVKAVEYIVTHPDDVIENFPSFKDMGI